MSGHYGLPKLMDGKRMTFSQFRSSITTCTIPGNV